MADRGRPLEDFLQPEHPDTPGWREWRVGAAGGFNRSVLGLLLVRLDDADHARLRMMPEERHGNLRAAVHGGAILSLVDVALFAIPSLILGHRLTGGVTVDVQTQFISGGKLGVPLDAVGELVRETGRMIFSRGLVMQGDTTVASYSGILRKIDAK